MSNFVEVDVIGCFFFRFHSIYFLPNPRPRGVWHGVSMDSQCIMKAGCALPLYALQGGLRPAAILLPPWIPHAIRVYASAWGHVAPSKIPAFSRSCVFHFSN
jgi:hypothetical protein